MYIFPWLVVLHSHLYRFDVTWLVFGISAAEIFAFLQIEGAQSTLSNFDLREIKTEFNVGTIFSLCCQTNGRVHLLLHRMLLN